MSRGYTPTHEIYYKIMATFIFLNNIPKLLYIICLKENIWLLKLNVFLKTLFLRSNYIGKSNITTSKISRMCISFTPFWPSLIALQGFPLPIRIFDETSGNQWKSF